MRTFHRIVELEPVDGPARLIVAWDDGTRRPVDLSALVGARIGPNAVSTLEHPTIEDGGLAAAWTRDGEFLFDVDAEWLWRHAAVQAGEMFLDEDLKAWRDRNNLDRASAARALGLAEADLIAYESGAAAIPKIVRLARDGYESRNSRGTG